MPVTTEADRQRLRGLSREELRAHQWRLASDLYRRLMASNAFYQEKFSAALTPTALADWSLLPTTAKHELSPCSDSLPGQDAEGQFATARNRTFDVASYSRLHRTSGSTGRPLIVLDTAADWEWWVQQWQFVLDAAEVTAVDRVFLAFSFGPFVGFWSAHDAAFARGCLTIPGGGLSTPARLELLRESRATVLCCTPSYALHLAQAAHDLKAPRDSFALRRIVVAGEPGGSIASIRGRMESAWNATVIDHSGATEVGPWGFGDLEGRGVFVNESAFYPEFVRVGTDEPAEEGELCELILTTLGRLGAPLVRYRTGDLVRWSRSHDFACRFAFLEGGVLGRADDMMIIRGVNVFPTAIEAILREAPEIVEYRLIAEKAGEMDELRIEVEASSSDPERISRLLQVRLGLRVAVALVEPGSLPRFEAKGKRFIDNRAKPANPASA
ncbi:MAG TPA: AMP-binding protein [Pirellulaceae bacterium]|jgi:phenylacetate-CoA ligase|nr:AMP-binding protein [Pirellulaceae bacterium]